MKFSDMKEVGKDGEIKFANNGHMRLVCFNPTKKDVKVLYGPYEEIIKPNDGFVTMGLHPGIFNGADNRLTVKTVKGVKLTML